MPTQCPNCQTDKFLKKILYGMPGDGFNFEKFHVGGCIPSNATVHCANCEWEDEDISNELGDVTWVG